MDEKLSAWFAREILPHEAALVRYLTRAWPNRDEVSDLRQDIYVKAYEAAKSHRPAFAKSFLFAIARNLIVDRVRRNRIVSIDAIGDPNALNVLIDEVSPERRLNSRQELKQLASAFELLPPKCREVVWLRKVDHLPQSEVAQLLGISVRTVEFQVQKGMRILAHVLFGESSSQRIAELDESNGSESEDGKQ